jgi:hypothetical protein
MFIPFSIICACLLLFFLIIINKTLEGLNLEEAGKVSNVLLDTTIGNTEKVRVLKDLIKVDQNIIGDLNNEAYDDEDKIIAINDRLYTLLENRNTNEDSAYSEKESQELINFYTFKKILNLVYSKLNDLSDKDKIDVLKTYDIPESDINIAIENNSYAKYKLYEINLEDNDEEEPPEENIYLNKPTLLTYMSEIIDGTYPLIDEEEDTNKKNKKKKKKK